VVEVRPATADDVRSFFGSVATTVRAKVALQDGKIIAIGGLAYFNGRVVAFADLGPEIKKHPVTLHKAALAVMAEAKARGHRHIYAGRSDNEPTARRWMDRLGFVPVDEDATVLLCRL